MATGSPERTGMLQCQAMQHDETITAAEYTYTVLFKPEPEGGYTVTCPALPGLVTYGETLEEARSMAADAIRGYIECLREDGEPIPESDPAPPLVDRVRVKAAG
jgi:antitoxin HicB